MDGTLGEGWREGGQMTVELAVVLPVTIAVVLVAINLLRFSAACASFDRVALDAVVSQGVAPAGDQNRAAAVDEVRSCIQGALQDDDLAVEVSAEQLSGGAGDVSGGRGVGFPVSPLLTRFICTMHYRPWPQVDSFAGVRVGTPLTIDHTRSLVVDRFRAGVVV